MTMLGKILTVLILLMSTAFLLIAATVFQTHRDWRDVALKNKTKIEDMQVTIQNYQREIEDSKGRLALEQAARRFALAALQTRVEGAEAALTVANDRLSNEQRRAGELSTTIATSSQTLDTKLKENETLRVTLRDAQQVRDKTFDELIATNDKLNEAEGTKENLKERHDQLVAMYTQAKAWLARLGQNENDPVDGKPRDVQGLVTKVGQKDLLEISIGHDDGLKKGHSLEVYRGGQYLGRVVVVQTWPDRAVVQVLPNFKQGPIKVSDRVATKLG